MSRGPRRRPDRMGTTEAIGVDETSFLAGTGTERTRWVSGICDVENRFVIDVIEGRQDPDLDRWLTKRRGVDSGGQDHHVGPPRALRTALKRHLPDATVVVGPFHVVAVGTRCVDATRRWVQNEVLGHRAARQACSTAAASCWPWPRSDSTRAPPPSTGACWPSAIPMGTSARRGEPVNRQESLHDLYCLYGEPALAGRWIDGLIDDCGDADATEVRGMARTLKRWREHILSWHAPELRTVRRRA